MISEDALNIRYSLSKKGFRVRINSHSYAIRYPPSVWNAFPPKIKKIIVENFVYLSTYTLPVILNKRKTFFDLSSPILVSFFLKPILSYIPACADEHNLDTFSLLKRFINSVYDFKSYNFKLVDYRPKANNRSVNLFTFGKDSLLGYAIAEEIGLNPVLVYVEEPDVSYIDEKTGKKQHTYENKHKDILIRDFSEEFRKPIYKVKHGLSATRHPTHFGIEEADLPYGSQLTEYALLALPFTHFFKARYIVYGNEASCSNTYLNKDGLLTNPVFDQSGEWVVEISKMLKLISQKIGAVSLIEPIHEIAITRILHRRYPQYAKYQMSCFAASNSARKSRWCHECSKCARMYLFLMANSIKPQTVGFRENMFKKDKMHLYTLFGDVDGNSLPYDLSGVGRDEMLFAFYLAYKNGAKGYLVNRFKKLFLEEAEERRDMLCDEFFSVHDSVTIPWHLKKKIMNIYKDELENISFG